MGLFDKLFGAKEAPPPRDLPTEAELLASAPAGDLSDLGDALEALEDVAAFALLLKLLPVSVQHARVEVIDHLAEFELDEAQQETLLLAAVTDVPGVQWTAASTAAACDFGAMCARFSPEDPAQERLWRAIGEVLSALAEVTLTTGPAGTFLDVENGAKHLVAWSDSLARFGTRPQDLVTLAMAAQLCKQADEHDDDLDELGFGEQLLGHLQAIKAQVLEQGGRDGAWAETLPMAIEQGGLGDALVALQAAAVAEIPIRASLEKRVAANPSDEPTWDLALAAGVDASMLSLLAPVATATLQFRRLGEDELCSPASQVGCLKCGGEKAAEDEEMMVPRALRDRLLPLLATTQKMPGEHEEFLVECLAAPDPSLRYHALVALGNWQPTTLSEQVKDIVEQLADDSMPVVQNQALELRRAFA